MKKHVYTETTKINYSKIEERLLQINNYELLENFNKAKLLKNIPTLIMATGGSKAAAYYLKIFLESNGIICEVIEPRDYFYKENIDNYQRLIAISNSGKSNGILDALKSFKGDSILITGEYKKQQSQNFDTIYWSNNSYLDNKEKSFISIIPTLAPMLALLQLNILTNSKNKNLSSQDLKKINDKLKLLLEKSEKIVSDLKFNFKYTNLIQIMSGYDTTCSSSILESNIVETGTSSVVVHDKGSYCHGRSNLEFQNQESPIIYLSHQMKELDNQILSLLKQEYPNIFLFQSFDEEESIFWKEYYLALQMYFLSKKISEEKNIDITMPEYNPQVVKKLFLYRGEM